MSVFVQIPLVVLLAVGMVACSEQKKLDEMHGATLNMRDTTDELLDVSKKLGETTTGLSLKTDELAKITSEMRETTLEMNRKMEQVTASTQEVGRLTSELYDSSRQGVSLQLRREALDALNRAQSNGKKVEEASAYFMSFEFQLWTGFAQDGTEAKRTELINDAVAEFFKAVKEFADDSESVNPFAQADPRGHVNDASNKAASFNAISAALHRLNRKQEEVIAKNSAIKPVSMYSLIIEALKVEKDLNEGRLAPESVAEYQIEVLNNKATALRLLQSRHNFLATIFLAEVLPKDGLQNKVSSGLNYYLKWGQAWELNLDERNLAQTNLFSRYLKGALATRAALQSLGVEPKVDATLAAFLESMQVKTTDVSAGAQLAAARTELVGLIGAIQKK